MSTNRSGSQLILLALFVFAFLIAGCGAKPKIPIYADPDLDQMDIKIITLLPVVDRRVDKSYELDLEKSIGNRVEKKLKKIGYTVYRPGTFSDTLEIPNDEIAEMEPHELSILGSAGTKHMFIIYLDDASSSVALGYSFKIEATGILILKQTGAMLWKDKGIGSSGQGGLYGCMMAGVTKGESMNMSVNSMLASFPKTPNKRK